MLPNNIVVIETDIVWHGTPSKGKLTIALTAPGITTKEVNRTGIYEVIVAAMKATNTFPELKSYLTDMLGQYMPKEYIQVTIKGE